MNFYPLKLIPVTKDIIWGGNILRERYGKLTDKDNIAESWELTVRDDGMSVISNGSFKGMTMDEFLLKYPLAYGSDYTGETFPLLIKFIDACDDLSIQVHPDDEYAKSRGEDSGKTEMWYIVEAADDASLIYGLRDGISEEDFANALHNGDTYGTLNKISIHKGESYFIPAGQVHAICRGALIAEIQQNSNTTYRIYDYDRVDAGGKKRDLHLSHAMNTVRCRSSSEITEIRFSQRQGRRKNLTDGEVLCDCVYFRVTKVKCNGECTFTVGEKAFVSILFTNSENTFVSCGGETVAISRGDSIFIPAGAGNVTVKGNADFLVSEI